MTVKWTTVWAMVGGVINLLLLVICGFVGYGPDWTGGLWGVTMLAWLGGMCVWVLDP